MCRHRAFAFLVTSLFYSMFEATWPSFFAEMFFRMFFYSRSGWGRSSGDSDRGKDQNRADHGERIAETHH